jgi:hypothetical protein
MVGFGDMGSAPRLNTIGGANDLHYKWRSGAEYGSDADWPEAVRRLSLDSISGENLAIYSMG